MKKKDTPGSANPVGMTWGLPWYWGLLVLGFFRDSRGRFLRNEPIFILILRACRKNDSPESGPANPTDRSLE
jgi:hypothetical protein